MKAVKIILEVLAALAAIAGVVYVIATYGDKIVAWAKRLLGHDCQCDCLCQCDCEGDCDNCDCEGDCEDCDCCDCDCCDCDDADLVCEEDLTDEAPAEAPADEATEADFEG